MRSDEETRLRTFAEPPSRPEANARLTAATGLVLLVLFVAEVVTVALQPRKVLTIHVVFGMIMVPLVVLKLVSTIWRMVNYYRGKQEYKIKGHRRRCCGYSGRCSPFSPSWYWPAASSW